MAFERAGTAEVRYTLELPAEKTAYEFNSKNELVDFVAWLISGYPEIQLVIKNTRKSKRQNMRRVVTAELPAVK